MHVPCGGGVPERARRAPSRPPPPLKSRTNGRPINRPSTKRGPAGRDAARRLRELSPPAESRRYAAVRPPRATIYNGAMSYLQIAAPLGAPISRNGLSHPDRRRSSALPNKPPTEAPRRSRHVTSRHVKSRRPIHDIATRETNLREPAWTRLPT
ncbi:hypothetical protein EVAR_68712_1 [Eumeta japonica]|uniref:Uncharacterized protein n=1 Tax=Eumeta variegata TaxID=151549 RepID=A0A4C2A3B1_EUMVA|nr:hypothetical protein EVAR_68712_1 [Eumeta japonica]